MIMSNQDVLWLIAGVFCGTLFLTVVRMVVAFVLSVIAIYKFYEEHPEYDDLEFDKYGKEHEMERETDEPKEEA